MVTRSRFSRLLLPRPPATGMTPLTPHCWAPDYYLRQLGSHSVHPSSFGLIMTTAKFGSFTLVLLLLLAAAHLCGYIFQRLRQPRVVGEIVGGILGTQVLLGTRCELFVPQRLDRIHARRLARGIIAEEHPHRRREQARNHHRFQRQLHRPLQNLADSHRPYRSQQHA